MAKLPGCPQQYERGHRNCQVCDDAAAGILRVELKPIAEFVEAARADIVRVSEEALQDPHNLAIALRWWLQHKADHMSIQQAIEAWNTVATLEVHHVRNSTKEVKNA